MDWNEVGRGVDVDVLGVVVGKLFGCSKISEHMAL